MKPKFVVVGGGQSAEVALKLPTIVGRSSDATVQIPGAAVSRQHCEIYENDGQICIRDLGSLNGTFVNDQQIQDDTLLSTGDLVRIGPVTFRADFGGEGSAEATGFEDLADSEAGQSAVVGYEESDDGSFVNIDEVDFEADEEEEAEVAEGEFFDDDDFDDDDSAEVAEADDEVAEADDDDDEDEEEEDLDDFLKALGD